MHSVTVVFLQVVALFVVVLIKETVQFLSLRFNLKGTPGDKASGFLLRDSHQL